MKKILFVLFGNIIFLTISAQTLKLDEVILDLSSKSFKESLPFDVPFIIKGEAGGDIAEIKILYGVDEIIQKKKELAKQLPLEKKTEIENKLIKLFKKYYFIDPNSIDVEGYVNNLNKWQKINKDDKSFAILCGPIHPNTVYDFKIIISYTATIKNKGELNKSIENIIIPALNKEKLDGNDLKKLNNTFNELIQNSLNYKGSIESNDYFNFSSIIYKTKFDAIMDIISKINTNNSSINTSKKMLTINYINPIINGKKLSDSLLFLLKNQALLTDYSKKILQSSLLPSTESCKNVSVLNVAEFMNLVYSNNSLWEQIINGEAKFNGTTLEPALSFDISSLKLFYAFFQVLGSNAIIYKSGTDEIIMFNSFKIDINKVILLIRDLLENIEQLQNNINIKKVYISNFMPDIEILVAQEIKFVDASIIDIGISADKNPYIGLDVGIVYAPNLNMFFSNYGLNVYFKPVNKKAQINQLQGSDKFWKIFSVYFGITNTLSSVPNDNFKNLFNSNSLILGTGIRFNRVLRVNVGGLLYYNKSQNDIVDNTTLHIAPTISFAIDINVARGFGKIGEILKIN
jgi:hypothetical protein